MTIQTSQNQNPDPEQSREHQYEGLDYNTASFTGTESRTVTASQTGLYEEYEIPIPDFIVKEKGRRENSTSLQDMREQMEVTEDYQKMIKMKTI